MSHEKTVKMNFFLAKAVRGMILVDGIVIGVEMYLKEVSTGRFIETLCMGAWE